MSSVRSIGAEEARDALHVENVDELVGRAVRPPRAERLIGELHERRLIVRRLDHAIELGLLATLLRRLQLARVAAELAGQMDGLLDFRAESQMRAVGANAAQHLLDARVNFLCGFLREFG